MADPLPGPYGKSWFELGLDVTAPIVSFGEAYGASAGQTLVVPYVIDEPWLIAAQVVAPNLAIYDMVIGPDDLSVALPANAQGGTWTVRAFTRDDVGNEAVWNLAVQVVGEEAPAPEPDHGTPSHAFTFGPITRGEPLEFEIPGSVTLVREIEVVVPGVVSPRRQPLELVIPGHIHALRGVEFSIDGLRTPAVHLAKIKAEDELLLLLS